MGNTNLNNKSKFFENLEWKSDRMLLNDLVFRLQHYKNNDTWELGEECFMFFKIKNLVDQYEKFFQLRPDFKPDNIFELGMFDGGSIAFWYEIFRPEKHIAIDIRDRSDSNYFKKFIAAKQLQEKIKTYWKTNQSDSEKLKQLYKDNFKKPLDLIIDDASHFYEPTKASFEALFPLLRPGGLYVIEDWAWGHWKEFFSPKHAFARKKVLTKLIFELVEATGSNSELISNLTIYQGFTIIEKGNVSDKELSHFNLEKFINRKPDHPLSVKEKIKHLLRK